MKPGRMPNCPTCRVAEAVRFAHSRWMDPGLALLRLYPFRCDACGAHFYRFAFKAHHS